MLFVGAFVLGLIVGIVVGAGVLGAILYAIGFVVAAVVAQAAIGWLFMRRSRAAVPVDLDSQPPSPLTASAYVSLPLALRNGIVARVVATATDWSPESIAAVLPELMGRNRVSSMATQRAAAVIRARVEPAKIDPQECGAILEGELALGVQLVGSISDSARAVAERNLGKPVTADVLRDTLLTTRFPSLGRESMRDLMEDARTGRTDLAFVVGLIRKTAENQQRGLAELAPQAGAMASPTRTPTKVRAPDPRLVRASALHGALAQLGDPFRPSTGATSQPQGQAGAERARLFVSQLARLTSTDWERVCADGGCADLDAMPQLAASWDRVLRTAHQRAGSDLQANSHLVLSVVLKADVGTADRSGVTHGAVRAMTALLVRPHIAPADFERCVAPFAGTPALADAA